MAYSISLLALSGLSFLLYGWAARSLFTRSHPFNLSLQGLLAFAAIGSGVHLYSLFAYRATESWKCVAALALYAAGLGIFFGLVRRRSMYVYL